MANSLKLKYFLKLLYLLIYCFSSDTIFLRKLFSFPQLKKNVWGCTVFWGFPCASLIDELCVTTSTAFSCQVLGLVEELK